MRNIDYIVIHCTASQPNATKQAILNYWKNTLKWENVGKEIDKEMFDIMILLNYPIELIKERLFLTRFTFLNVLRHKLLGNKLKQTPTNLYKLNK